jgi:ABC-type nitrate/sulfonate/bicarbonate transport system substrate-binding protein
MPGKALVRIVAVLAALLSAGAAAQAQDKLSLALGQRGNWDTAIAPLGQQAGIFQKHGLTLDILWTQGAGESQQALLAGSADIGLLGTQSAFGVFAKGAPLRIVAAEATGAADYWYVRADSPIRSFKDTAGRTVAFSTVGASTNTMALAFTKDAGVKANLTATGSPSATLVQVMSGQIDVGWAAPPFGLEQINKNQIRVIGYGKDLRAVRGQTIRVLGAFAPALDARPAVFGRFLQAYRETIDWMYAGDDALEAYAAFAQIPLATAKQVRDEFFPRDILQPDRVMGLDALMDDAVTFKYIAAPLRPDQIADLIRIPAAAQP